MASGVYLDDIAKLVDEGKVSAGARVAGAALGGLATRPPSLVRGSSPGAGMVPAHAVVHG